MLTYVLAKDGTRLMPTYNIRKVRRLLKSGRAVIAGHRPGLTIRLMYDLPEQEAAHVQPVEICEDTGYTHIGVSVKSEKHEFAHEQYDLLANEKQRRDDRRKYRHERRSRKRHRTPRFGNRTASRKPGWLAPSVKNKMLRHADIIDRYAKVLPLTSVALEMGSFDTQELEAMQTGAKLPEGTDYQRGKRYQISTLREAVFYRDGYTCQVCGKSMKDHAVLRVHHAGYWRGDHTNRMGNLVTVCTKCHTAANHKPGGGLYEWRPKVRPMTGAAYMNSVRWKLYEEVKHRFPGIEIHVTYGSHTKVERRALCLPKTHANDAYVMGKFHPAHKAHEVKYQKRRRGTRVLQKFYDAKYIDSRDGTKKSGSQLSCGRTNRSESRHSGRDLRQYRQGKVSKGRVSVRRQRYPWQPGDTAYLDGRRYTVVGTSSYGKSVLLDPLRASVPKKLSLIRKAGSWVVATG